MLQGGDNILYKNANNNTFSTYIDVLYLHFKPANNLQELDELIQQSNVSTAHQYIFVLNVVLLAFLYKIGVGQNFFHIILH